MSTVKPASSAKRSYRSSVRQEQAAATRQRMVAQARRLFAEQGYAATSIETIAKAAGVAVPTFYATFGSKNALLLALLDAMEMEADIPSLEAELQATSDPRKQIEAIVAFGVRLYARATDVLETIRAAGTSEKDLGALWREGEGRRRRAQVALVRSWSKRQLLQSHLTAAKATDIFWALTGADSYLLFVKECGWSQDYYAKWLTATLISLLLHDGRD